MKLTMHTFLLISLFLVSFGSAAVVSDEEGRELHSYYHNTFSHFGVSSALGLVVVESTNSFSDTRAAIVGAINGNGMIGLVSEFDHAENAQNAGLELNPNTVVVFGNPSLGTPIMENTQLAALDLPQKILVWQDDDGKVYVGFNPPIGYLTSRYGHRLQRVETLETINGALTNLAATAAGVDTTMVDTSVSYKQRRQIRSFRGIYSRRSNAPFEETWGRLIAAIGASPANVAFTVDHQQNAITRLGETTLGPTRLVVFGNPNLGTPLMQVSPTAGMDLPLKILVTERPNGRVVVSTNVIGFLRRRHGLKGIRESLMAIRGAIENFMTIAAEGSSAP